MPQVTAVQLQYPLLQAINSQWNQTCDITVQEDVFFLFFFFFL